MIVCANFNRSSFLLCRLTLLFKYQLVLRNRPGSFIRKYREPRIERREEAQARESFGMKKTLYITQLNESVHESMTKYRKQSKQNIPNYAGKITTRVFVSQVTCEHFSLKYITKLQVTKLQHFIKLHCTTKLQC